MRRFILPAMLAFLCCGCASEMRIEQDPWMSLGRYRRVGVLPFSDSQGRGRELAERVGRGLARLGYDPVDLAQLESVFARIRIDYSSGLSLQSLADVRRATLAEALVFGSVDSEFKEVSLVAVETERGELIFKAKARAPRGRPFRSGGEAVDAVLQALSRVSPRRMGPRKDKEEPELPEPQ